MFIDPERDGCIIILFDGRIQRLRGNPEDCVKKIMKFIFKIDYNENEAVQTIIPILDCNAMGRIYKDIFERNRIKYTPLKIEEFIK